MTCVKLHVVTLPYVADLFRYVAAMTEEQYIKWRSESLEKASDVTRGMWETMLELTDRYRAEKDNE